MSQTNKPVPELRRVVELLMHFLAYVDDTSLGSQDPVWLQNSLQFLTECFARVGLSTNIDKTEAMVCIPQSLRTHHSSAGYRRRLAGHGAACVNSTRPAGTPTRLPFWWEQRDLPGQNGLQAEEHSDSEEE
jgi:hypothetical protein